MTSSLIRRTHGYQPALARFGALPLLAATCLLYAGGFTTSIEAGMAFLDWPLSNGSINPAGWLVDEQMRAEHSHRLLGALVGLLAIILVVWTWMREGRSWVRRLARVTLLLVILQGFLGGARVRFDELNLLTDHNLLANGFAVLHATGAQLVVACLVAVATATSRFWVVERAGQDHPVGRPTRILGVVACLTLLVQVVIGAIMRHGDAGLAIHTFPFSTPEGAWLPPAWNWAVGINFAHRIGAVATTLAVGLFAAWIWRDASSRQAFGWRVCIPLVLVVFQIYLGALATWTFLNEHAATFHTLNGAFLLASTWWLTFLTFRLPSGSGAADVATSVCETDSPRTATT